jgi:hypothetical protein
VIDALKELWSKRPPDSEPLKVISWYLGSKSSHISLTSNIVIQLPLAEFNLHQYDSSNLNVNATVSLVALTMVKFCSQSYENHCEMRWTIIKHVVSEILQRKNWDGLVIYRVNQEHTHPNVPVDRIYQEFIIPELEKLRPNIQLFHDTHRKTIQILFNRHNKF